MQLVVTSSNMDHRHHPPTSPIIPVKMKKILLKNEHQQYSHFHCQSETHGRFPSKNKFVEKFPTWNSRINIGFTGVWWVWSSAAAIVVLHFTTLHLHCSTVSTILNIYSVSTVSAGGRWTEYMCSCDKVHAACWADACSVVTSPGHSSGWPGGHMDIV